MILARLAAVTRRAIQVAQQVCKIPFVLAVLHLEVYPKESIRNAHVEMVETAVPRLPWTSCPRPSGCPSSCPWRWLVIKNSRKLWSPRLSSHGTVELGVELGQLAVGHWPHQQCPLPACVSTSIMVLLMHQGAECRISSAEGWPGRAQSVCITGRPRSPVGSTDSNQPPSRSLMDTCTTHLRPGLMSTRSFLLPVL